MPIEKFRSLAQASRALHPAPDASTGVRTALLLAGLVANHRLGIRLTEPGVRKFRTLEEGEAERERFGLAQLRSALAQPVTGDRTSLR